MSRRSLFTLLTALGTAGLLTGCLLQDVTSASRPPESFGKTQRGWHCPDVSGLYAWPPADGKAFGYNKSGGFDPHYRGGFLGLNIRGEARLWLSGPAGDGQPLVLRSRLINRAPELRMGRDTTEWQERQPHFNCRFGWVRLQADFVQGAGAYSSGEIREEVKMTLLRDGSLAVGQKVTIPRAAQPIGWGDVRFFSVPQSDRVVWNWSKFKRIGDSGAGLPPEDANLQREKRR